MSLFILGGFLIVVGSVVYFNSHDLLICIMAFLMMACGWCTVFSSIDKYVQPKPKQHSETKQSVIDSLRIENNALKQFINKTEKDN